MLTDQKPEELTVGWEALLERQLRDAQRTHATYPDTRKAHIYRRVQILNEDLGDIVLEKLSGTYSDPSLKTRLRRHISEVINLGADITRVLANVYDVPPRRRIKGSKAATRALLDLVKSTKWASKAPLLNRVGWFTGPVLEMPSIRGDALRRDIFTGDRVDVTVPDSDPFGDPVAASFTTYEGDQRVIKVVDDTLVRTFSIEDRQLLGEYAHGVQNPDGSPRFPGTLWRFDDPTDLEDYWSLNRHRRLVDATIDAGVIYAVLDWVRKSQNRKVLAFIGALGGIQQGATLDNETPITWDQTDQELPSKIEAVDFITPIDEFQKHLMLITRTQIESYGVPQSAITYDFMQDGAQSIPATALSLQHEKLTALRKRQMPFADRYERQSTYNLVALARAHGHEAAKGLPSLKELDSRLVIEFPPLSRFEDPKTFREEVDWQLGRGFTTDAEIYQLRHPELTLEECEEAVRKNLEVQAKFNDLKAKRNNDPAAEMQDENQRTGGLRGDPTPTTVPEPAPDPE